MTRLPVIAQRAESLLGASVVATAPVAGGDISTATRLRLSDGTTALVKTYPQAPEGFFDVEAGGLRWLVDAGGVACPEVLGSDDECLILRWIEPGKSTVDAAVAFGQALARTHAAGAPSYGWSGTASSGSCRCPTAPRRRGRSSTRPDGCCPISSSPATGSMATEDDATKVESVIGRLPELLPEEPPSRLHGDLWNGNVLWGLDGVAARHRPGGVRRPSRGRPRHAGAVRAAHLPRVMDAYAEVAPLADGWEERLPLHQLFPLLVHALHVRWRVRRRAAGSEPRIAAVHRCMSTGHAAFSAVAQARLAELIRDRSVPGAPRVLVVDDDRAVRESLRRSLEFNGYAVALAADGAEALASISGSAPDAW